MKINSFDGLSYRQEKDLIGVRNVPKDAYYGIQTLRAMENFQDITGVSISHFSYLINALVMVKSASAQANQSLGLLDGKKADAIVYACQKVLAGSLHEQFTVDVIQGGAGTSTNMNANEVIANLGLEYLGFKKGEYQYLHPNNDVNQSQSTNDVYPTAVRLAIVTASQELISSIDSLQKSLAKKADEFAEVKTMGRTQLQDAVPMSLGQAFGAFSTTLIEEIHNIRHVGNLLCEVNLGGTAIGTGLNAPPGYSELVIEKLLLISGLNVKSAGNLIEATSDMGAFVSFSGALKRLAIKLSKISNDCRLLSSGPRAGFNEINLPAMQPGSSIMPGKVNPVIPEAVNQVAYVVIGYDLTVTMAAESGQLQLNAFEPVIAMSILQSIRILNVAMGIFENKCISGITANKDRCASLVENSISLVTVLNPIIGYEAASRLAKEALESGASVVELVKRDKIISDHVLREVLAFKSSRDGD
jgi:aspartate ammonia-lyase